VSGYKWDFADGLSPAQSQQAAEGQQAEGCGFGDGGEDERHGMTLVLTRSDNLA
jgi:hypothetical protein